MATVNYGLSAEGFKRKRLPEIITSLNDRIADKLGGAIETTPNSIFGQIHGIYGFEIANLWELAENIYNAMYPSTAQGVSLSNAAGLAGIKQITAEKTIVKATCFGTEGTLIPYGAQISSSRNAAMIFSCDETNAVISADKANTVSCTLDSEPVAGVMYSITMDGIQKTYTAASGDNKTTVLTALAAQFTFGDRTLAVVNDVLTIAMLDAESTFAISFGAGISVSSLGSPVEFISEATGAVSPSVGELTNIITAYTGWSSVRNDAPAVVGRDDETDIALRQRWNASVYDRASAMVEAIQAAIYANVPGVLSAIVYENDSDEADEYGRPPHSIEAVIQGGEEQRIAKTIWQYKAAGIDTFGDEHIQIADSQGVKHVMNFNRPTEIKVWLNVVISENPDESISAVAVTEVTEALLKKGNEQLVGEDVVLQRYFATIFSATKGIGYINLTAATGDTPSEYTASNIVISPRELATFDMSRIEVTVAE